MIALKKFYGDELLRLALVLSLLKADPNEYLETETQQLIAGLHRSNGTDWSIEQEARTFIRPTHIHPKSLDHILANHERQIFDELNSLGRYNSLESNGRISSYIHTYLVNNVATETVAPVLSEEHGLEEAAASALDDGVSADDNVGQEVKVTDEDASEDETVPDLIVTVTPDYLNNRTEADLLADIVTTRTFDVNDFINAPDEVQIKKEPQESIIDVEIKEKRDESLFDDNAFDDYVSYFSERMKYELGEPNSVLRQNIADLEDYSGIIDDEKTALKDNSVDSERNAEDLEKYLLKNTPLDFEELNLGSLFNDVKIEVKRERASTSFTSASSSGVSEMESVLDDTKPDVKLEPDEGHHSGDELTQEDMDLIDVLWKQDVDMGFSVDNPALPVAPEATKLCLDDVEVELKRAEEKIQAEEREKDIEKVKASLLDDLDKDDDPWAGLSYVVDTETGEYILQGELPSELINSEETRFDLLEEAASIVVIGDEEKNESEALERGEGAEGAAAAMLHPAMARGVPHHHHHPLAHYHNQSLMRSMSSEQRWQDLASLLTIPPPPEQYHYHQTHHSHGVHGAATSYAPSYGPIAPPLPDKHPEPYASGPPLEGAYKVEAPPAQHHDGIYYQSPPAPELGATNNDGFLQSILNDEDLQLMDMAVNEGMYTMRILDGGSTVHHAASAPHHTHSHMMMTAERDSASDSAVSSMGSERVPSLSDGEWCDSAGSDTAHDYHSSKFRPYEASYGRDRGAPQKKHHMFGKRCFQEPAVKYEPCGEATTHYAPDHALHNMHADFARQQSVPAPHILPHSIDLNTAHSSHALLQSPSARYPPAAVERIRHNHTYTQPEPARDRRVRRVTEESTASAGHLTRDEKRAKALGIPIEVHEIINLPMDEFNERLSKHDLSEAQLSLIRDIRRRGKNKVAAQNCRKRKLDQITSLADEVRSVKDRKLRTQRDHAQLLADRQRAKERFANLYRHVFQNLRDAEGRPLSSAQYSLQQAADGNVVLVPRMSQHTAHYTHDPSISRADDEVERKTKTFDQ